MTSHISEPANIESPESGARRPVPGKLRRAKRTIQRFAFSLLLASSFGCAADRAPIPAGTVPEARRITAEDQEYGRQVLQELSEKYQLDYNHPRSNDVIDIVNRLTHAAHADADPWQVYIFRDPSFKNAAATRGNHVFIWSALLDSTRDDGEIATIIAHEISHVLARHTDPSPNEEVTRIIVGIGSIAVGMAASYATRSTVFGDSVGNLASGLTQEAANSVLLYPHSRETELEADRIGIFLLADAGYDPHAAATFWARAVSDPDFSSGFAFFSSHPPAEERLAQITQLLPAAVDRYQGRGTHFSDVAPNGSAQRSVIRTANAQSGSPAPNPHDSGIGAPSTERAQSVQAWKSGTPNDVAQNNGPIPVDDTFAASGISSGPPERGASQRDQTLQRRAYRVVKVRARLYPKASARVIPLGEFREGASILGAESKRGWVEVDGPDHGFVQLSDLAEENTEDPAAGSRGSQSWESNAGSPQAPGPRR